MSVVYWLQMWSCRRWAVPSVDNPRKYNHHFCMAVSPLTVRLWRVWTATCLSPAASGAPNVASHLQIRVTLLYGETSHTGGIAPGEHSLCCCGAFSSSQTSLTVNRLLPPPSGWVSCATTPTWPGVRTACSASLSSWRPSWTSSRAASSTTWKNTAIRCTMAYVSVSSKLFGLIWYLTL